MRTPEIRAWNLIRESSVDDKHHFGPHKKSLSESRLTKKSIQVIYDKQLVIYTRLKRVRK